ncbi:hypothetical protein AGMMS50239_10100 [Bacteroidia bacterium]|nr:hypothetical protein AGMMS50239_10100 [Bacteroidia bacterium]
MPGILVKGNEITVFSKGSPIIYINNRKLYDANELQRLKSTDIKTIELITNPGAKYDAEGRAVLLIKTNQKEEDGWAVQISETIAKGHFLNDQEDAGLLYPWDRMVNHI